MNNHMIVAQGILDQIKMGDKMALIAWGANQYGALPETNTHLGGIEFKIRTPLYQRGVRVQVLLNGCDLYDIRVLKVSTKEVKEIEKIEDIYCDQLVEVIDSMIEKDKKAVVFF